MSKKEIVGAGVGVIGMIATYAIGYFVGKRSDEEKAKQMEKKIEKSKKELGELKEEVGVYKSIDDARKASAQASEEAKKADEIREARCRELNEVTGKLTAVKASLTSELNRMDPSYEERLLKELDQFKKESRRLKEQLDSFEKDKLDYNYRLRMAGKSIIF